MHKSYKLLYSREYLEHLEKHYKSGNNALFKKIEIFLDELEEHPATGTGKPEALKWCGKSIYSRRLDKKNRLVYEILEEEKIVKILACLGHYEDK